MDNLGFVAFAVLMVGLVVVWPIVSAFRDRREHRDAGRQAEKSEALFRSMFPDLQPHFHPQNVVDYVSARIERGGFGENGSWDHPPGFAGAASATLEATSRGERTILKDAAGRKLAEFVFERKDGELGVIRLGAGKFTVNRKPHFAPSARYWHPEREFKWLSPGNWQFKTRVADEPFDSGDRGTSWSSGSSSSGSSSASTAAAAAGIVAAGGTFDGGGASAGWDSDGSSGSTDSGGDSSASSTSY